MSNMAPPRKEDDEICELEHLRKLFIGGLAIYTTEESLKDYYSQWGNVVDVVVMRDPTTKKSRGFGFITYSKAKMVDEAQSNRPHNIDGKIVDTKRALPRPERDSRESSISVKKLFVGGLKDNHDEETLREYFTQFGNVTSVKIITDKNTGKRRGFAYIGYDDYDAVDKAVLQKTHSIKYVLVDVKKSLYTQELQNRQNNAGNNNQQYNNNQMNGMPPNPMQQAPGGYRPPGPPPQMPPNGPPAPPPPHGGWGPQAWGPPPYGGYPPSWGYPPGPWGPPPPNWYPPNQWPAAPPVPNAPNAVPPNGVPSANGMPVAAPPPANWAPPHGGPPAAAPPTIANAAANPAAGPPGPPQIPPAGGPNFGTGYQQNYGGGPTKQHNMGNNRVNPYSTGGNNYAQNGYNTSQNGYAPGGYNNAGNPSANAHAYNAKGGNTNWK